MITGKEPFEHIYTEFQVIQLVLDGTRPDLPDEGFSDALWTLLIQTWLEESEPSDLQSARPGILEILERLQEEAKEWRPKRIAFAQVEREADGTSSIPPELAHLWLISIEQLVENTGLFP